jgi:hypothetical protein
MISLCQPNAWMDEEVMIIWVDQVLCPLILETAPAGILPIFDGVSSWHDTRFWS